MQSERRTRRNSQLPPLGVRLLMVILMAIGAPVVSIMSAQTITPVTVNTAFKSGERITYDLYFNWKFVWVKAGYATLSTLSTTYRDTPAYTTSLYSVSSKKVDAFFKMRDTLTSIVSTRLEPLYYRKGAEEGKRYTVDEAHYSYSSAGSHVAMKRTYQDGHSVENSHTDSRVVYDMLSILSQARSWNPASYVKGQKFNFPMDTGKKVEEQTLIYRGKKNIESDDGNTYRCLVFSFVEYKKGKEKEVITFFVSDDDNHLPIRLDMYLNIGSAKAFMKRAEGNRYPLSSIVKK